jgi:hypothetical protein
MTTFTTDDRKSAYDPGLGCVTPSSANGMEEPDLVAEAPYHPGYEDAVIESKRLTILSKEFDELLKVKDRHVTTSAKIIEFLKGGQKWDR